MLQSNASLYGRHFQQYVHLRACIVLVCDVHIKIQRGADSERSVNNHYYNIVRTRRTQPPPPPTDLHTCFISAASCECRSRLYRKCWVVSVEVPEASSSEAFVDNQDLIYVDTYRTGSICQKYCY